MDYLIIGAGPAGLQLGYLLAKTGRSFRILEAGASAGTFFKTYPRHRTLISSNKVYNGTSDPELNLRMDWNSLLSDDPELLFTRYTDRYFPPADVIVKYLSDFASKTQLPIEYDTRVTRVSRASDGGFRVETQQGRTFEAKRLIAATGVTRHNIPPIPGIEHAELYGDVSVDPKDFINKRVLIIGKGNSAFETADNLIPTAAVIHVAGPSSVRMAWRTHYVGHLRAVNNNFLDTYQLKSQNAVLDGNIQRIEKRDNGFVVTLSFSRANEVTKDLRYDRIILCTGFRFDASIFDESCRPELVIRDRFPNQTAEWESTNVPGLHFAGTIGRCVTSRSPPAASSTASATACAPCTASSSASTTAPSGPIRRTRPRPRPSWRRCSPASTAAPASGSSSPSSATPSSSVRTARRSTSRRCRSPTPRTARSATPRATSPSASSTARATRTWIPSTSRWAASPRMTPCARARAATCTPWCAATTSASSWRRTT
ncbi:NAD(P)-binding domain-containing protein [Cystobacter fuscus]